MPLPGALVCIFGVKFGHGHPSFSKLAAQSFADNQTIQESDWQLYLDFVRFWRFVLEVTCSSRLYENKRTFSVNLSCPSLDDSDWRGMSMLDLSC